MWAGQDHRHGATMSFYQAIFLIGHGVHKLSSVNRAPPVPSGFTGMRHRGKNIHRFFGNGWAITGGVRAPLTGLWSAQACRCDIPAFAY